MTKQEIDNGTVTLTDGTTKTLTEYLKETSINLIGELKKLEDAYSNELRNALQKTLGKKWTEIIKAIDKIKLEPEKPYDFNVNVYLSEILYPYIDEFEQSNEINHIKNS